MALLDFFNKRKKDEAAEMSFIDHLEDLRWHVVRSVVAILPRQIIVSLPINGYAISAIHSGWVMLFALLVWMQSFRAIQ